MALSLKQVLGLLALITVAVLGAWVLQAGGGRAAEPLAFCRARYAKAQTAADSTRVDRMGAASMRGGSGTCGALRRAGSLAPAI